MKINSKTLSYSIVIPVYRGEKTIETLFKQIKDFFDTQVVGFEVIFVFDAGKDHSWQIIKNLKNQFPDLIKGIKFNRNFGQHNALICGIKHSKGEWIITMDEDLQHHPKDIILLMEEQKKGDFDVVYGKYVEPKHPFFRNFYSFILRKLLTLSLPDLHPDYSPFRLLKASIAKETLTMHNSYTFLDGYFTWITSHISSVYVHHLASQAGKSSYSIYKLIRHTWNIFVTFSHLPIRLFIGISLLLFIFSFSYAIYIFVRKLIYNDLISGFATIAIFLGVGFGLVLLGIGILGEYILKINLKTTKKPDFYESEII